jgi:hypothetical protein
MNQIKKNKRKDTNNVGSIDKYKQYKSNRTKLNINVIDHAIPTTNASIAIIIPHRNRIDNIKHLLAHFADIQKTINKNKYDIYVIDQHNGDKFNRGLLLNIGFMLAHKYYDYDRYIFHDSDSVPSCDTFNKYFCDSGKNIHFTDKNLKHKFDEYLGGVMAFTSHDFIKLNGYPNTMFGMGGGEDEAIYNRCVKNNIVINRYNTCEYEYLSHKKAVSSEYNDKRKANILYDLHNAHTDGLSQLDNFFITIKDINTNDFMIDYEKINNNVSNGSSILHDFVNNHLNDTHDTCIVKTCTVKTYLIDYMAKHSEYFDRFYTRNYVDDEIQKKIKKLSVGGKKVYQHKKFKSVMSHIKPLVEWTEIESKIFNTFTVPKKFNYDSSTLEKNKHKKVYLLVQSYFDKFKNVSLDTLKSTLQVIHNTFNEVLYFRIRNNKLECSYHIYNMNNEHDWYSDMKYIDQTGNVHNLDDKYIKIVESRGKDYVTLKTPHYISSNNCLLNFESFGYTDGNPTSYVSDFKTMIITTIKLFVNVPDCDILINRKDFAYFNKDMTFAYDHVGSTKKLDMSNLYFLGSQSVKQNSNDIPVPSADEWTDINKYKNIKIIEWKDRKASAFFRGRSTGCGTNLTNNKRMKLADISYTMNKQHSSILDVALSGLVTRFRVYKGVIEPYNIEKYKYLVGKFVDIKDQLKCKYIFNIEGNAQAYRYPNEFKKGSLILNVASDFSMWFEPLIKNYKHIIEINSDFSNLADVIKYLVDNDDKAQIIAQNGLLFSKKYITKKMICFYWFCYMLNINKKFI